jgi:ABC-type transport system involved in multi-copper enzyme maturation permease subunit
MIIHIAKKEVLEHIKSFRFLVAFLFILATFFIMMLTRQIDYKRRYDDYLLRVRAQEESLEKYANYNRIGAHKRPIVPPASMEIIVDPAVGSDVVESGRSLDDDPSEFVDIKLDMIALIGILGSLLALLLSYDSINREVHEGTIRLLLSSGVPRMKIILGKTLGGSLAAMLPIAAIFLIASVWLAIIGGQGWGANQWVSFLGIFVVSIVYIMFFYCLGTFLSSVVLDQTLSALSCFGAWVLFVLVIPVISPYIAKAAIEIPDQNQVEREVLLIDQEREKALRNKIVPLVMDEGLSFTDAYSKANIDGSMDVLQKEFQERMEAIRNNFKIAATRQTKFSIQLSCISPYSMYLVAVEELSGLGFERFEHLNNVISNWGQISGKYLEDKFNESRRLDPSFGFESKLDVSGMPRFQYVEPGLSYKYSSALPYMLLLVACFLVPLGLYLVTFNSKRRLF